MTKHKQKNVLIFKLEKSNTNCSYLDGNPVFRVFHYHALPVEVDEIVSANVFQIFFGIHLARVGCVVELNQTGHHNGRRVVRFLVVGDGVT